MKTTAWVTYDDGHLYVGLRCEDPDPSRIRAPFVERDDVVGTDDNVAVFLDTRGDRQTAVELRVSPRGQQADAVFNDATQQRGLLAGLLLRHRRPRHRPSAGRRRCGSRSRRCATRSATRQEWAILVWRNYPREYRYFIHSRPVPRGSDCLDLPRAARSSA